MSPHRAELIDKILSIKAGHITRTLKARFEAERLTKYFSVVRYAFEGTEIRLRDSDCLRLEFQTPKHHYPDRYDSAAYGMLVILSLPRLEAFTPAVLQDLDRIAKRDNIDQIVLWTTGIHTQELRDLLKRHHVTMVHIQPNEINEIQQISLFMVNDNVTLEQLLPLNILCDVLIKRLKKLFHLVLSEIAAPIYDELYGEASVGTTKLKAKEEALLTEICAAITAQRAKPGGGRRRRASRAIDIGCGTGRHTFMLRSHFDEVYAFDFSRKMIEEATKRKKALGDTQIHFMTADFEHEDFTGEPDFAGNVDLIVASFGMGSFIEDSSRMLRRFHSWLRPGGTAFLSFYNSRSITDVITPNWRDTSLSARLDADRSTLEVSLNREIVFHVYCKAYSSEIEGLIRSMFQGGLRKITYPTLLALMPNTLLADPRAKEFFEHIDEHLAQDEKYAYGYYTFVICRKAAGASSEETADLRITSLLRGQKIEFQELEHEEIWSSAESARINRVEAADVVKTVVYVDSREPAENGRPASIIVVAVAGANRVAEGALARLVGMPRDKIRRASREDLFALGYPMGGVAPIGFEARSVLTVVDKSLLEQRKERVLLLGGGRATRSLKIAAREFKRLVKSFKVLELREEGPGAGSPPAPAPATEPRRKGRVSEA
jgi:prolyl-tRNA editing enzyme YbaK/EbsC (Cys-tRNA(Pro) deacylase)/ubiquinone/menaquinone biosynthesis C-methylase UbiE